MTDISDLRAAVATYRSAVAAIKVFEATAERADAQGADETSDLMEAAAARWLISCAIPNTIEMGRLPGWTQMQAEAALTFGDLHTPGLGVTVHEIEFEAGDNDLERRRHNDYSVRGAARSISGYISDNHDDRIAAIHVAGLVNQLLVGG